MRENVLIMKDRLLAALSEAGRNKRKIRRKLDMFEKELASESGEKRTDWSNEYHQYLLDNYQEAILLAIKESEILEEYEWAAALVSRKEKTCIVTLEEELVNNVN